MTLNEKKILALLVKNGPMSKKAIQQKAKLGWATVYKMINRLKENGLIFEAGTEIQKNIQGKDALLYEVSSSYPLILSIDVEYSRTQILLTNLKREEIFVAELETPILESVSAVSQYSEGIIRDFLKRYEVGLSDLVGIGVCVPFFINRETQGDFYNVLERMLSARLGILVKTSSPSQAYAYFHHYKRVIKKNSLVIVNRGGIGVGVILDGKVYDGDNRLAGEVGHIVIPGNPNICKCGNVGCLETKITSKEIYRQYQAKVAGTLSSELREEIEEATVIKELFSLWEDGHVKAGEIIDEIASTFAYAIHILSIVVDIEDIYIAGKFGEGGKKIIPMIEAKVEQRQFVEKKIRLVYEDFDEGGFLKVGPAHQIFDSFLTL